MRLSVSALVVGVGLYAGRGCPAGLSKHGYGTLARPRDEADDGTRLAGMGWMSHTR